MNTINKLSPLLRPQIRFFRMGFPKKVEVSPPETEKTGKPGESQRMKKFHEQLKLEKIPSGGTGMRYIDLVLVDTNPKNGELIANSEKDPTKWGDWQHGGRVTDF